ncbi:DUF2493 domain-containing protein [Candidatus Albibeggiatoa sp. nov. BB20]|uniref:DUF2493 domain-containing protein n=1 Tax=Candidatus Albibeggiatoa sp. nov. BB20 TaxID=3162723 RepID=UPI003365552C
MKLIIAGSRDFNNYKLLCQHMQQLNLKPSEVISGTCRGADLLGEQWANDNNVNIVQFPANWNKYGKKAGPIRNKQMADYGTALIAFWNGKAGGTSNMVRLATVGGLKVYIVEYNNLTDSLF